MTTRTMSPGDLDFLLTSRVANIRAEREELAARRATRAEGGARRQGHSLRRAAVGSLLWTALFAAAVFADSGTVNVEVANRTLSASGTTNDGALITYIGDLDATLGSAGTGIFNSFVRVQASPQEDGYNTDGTLEFDTKAGIWTRAILVSEIPVVSVSGQFYWELFADINDDNNKPKIRLTDLEVYFTDSATLTGYAFGASATKVYDFAGQVLINDVNQGSGRGDLRYRIPLTGISIPTSCDYLNPACTTYFVLYNQWGDPADGTYASDGGFEEWKVKEYPTLKIVKNTV
ncbi:MAG: hypothetical protein ACRDGJ_11735, partial [Candidatus Limnocylindria bacterium]